MNDYYDLINILRTLQIQGYPKQHILDVYYNSKNIVLFSLKQDLIMAILGDKIQLIKEIKRVQAEVKSLYIKIEIGLLESEKART